MAFTYDLATDGGKVRLGLSDTDSTAYVFEDDEIAYFLTAGGSVSAAVVEGLRTLLVSAARRARYYQLQGVTIDTRAQIEGIKASIEAVGGMPTLTVGYPAGLPMDDSSLYDGDSTT